MDDTLMPEIEITLEQLRGMIGIRLSYNNKSCQVIEILEDGPSLVLQNNENNIQKDQHGHAHRRVPEIHCIPILSGDKKELSELFLSLDLL